MNKIIIKSNITIIAIFCFFCCANKKQINIALKDLSKYKHRIYINHGDLDFKEGVIPLNKFITSLHNSKTTFRMASNNEKYITILVETKRRTLYYSYFYNSSHGQKILKLNKELLKECRNLNIRFLKISSLIRKGADANSTGSYSALSYTISKKNYRLSKYLIRNGADVNIRDTEGNTPLSKASWYGLKKHVHLLVNNGAAVNTGAKPPVCEASYRGHNDIIQYLIDNKADINIRDYEGKTPLDYASVGGQNETIRLLLSYGSGVNDKDKWSRSPLFSAVDKNRIETIKLLLSKGANVNEKNYMGRTPLFFASMRNDNNIVQLLISNGADVNARSNNNDIPLHFAARYGTFPIVALLIKNASKINVQNNDPGITPLHEAVFDSNIKIIKILIKHGARKNIGTTRGFYIGGISQNPYFPAGSKPVDFAKILNLNEIIPYLR